MMQPGRKSSPSSPAPALSQKKASREGVARCVPSRLDVVDRTANLLRRLDLDLHRALLAHFDKVLHLVLVPLGHLVHRLILVAFDAVLHADLADFRLAVRHLARHRDDEAALLVARGEAVVRTKRGRHDPVAWEYPAQAAEVRNGGKRRSWHATREWDWRGEHL